MNLVTDIWSVVGVHYHLYPGGVECMITYQDETGFSEAKAWVDASQNEIEHYDRQKLSSIALEKAVGVMNDQLSTLNDAIEKREAEMEKQRQRGDFDTCECGDYRYQHENHTGKCTMPNDLCHGFNPCLGFRLASDESGVSG